MTLDVYNPVGQQESNEPTCVHRWEIDPPDGTHSQGVCQRCGATRMFSNSLQNEWTRYGDMPFTHQAETLLGHIDTLKRRKLIYEDEAYGA